MDSYLSHTNTCGNLETVLLPLLHSVLVETSIHAHKSLLLLLSFMGPQSDDMLVVPELSSTDRRFPLDELNKLEKPAAENKDAGESDEEEDSDDDNGHEEDDDSAGEEGGADDDDDDDDDDSEGDTDSDEGTDDDEDDDEDDEDDDEDDEDEDDDEGDEEDEENQPPSKKKK